MQWLALVIAAISEYILFHAWAYRSLLLRRSRVTVTTRVLVTGSRGKSGTVRLTQALLATKMPTYAKVTGTVAQEIWVDGSVHRTRRIGPIAVSELAEALYRAKKAGATAAVIECMAVVPKLIQFAQRQVIDAQVVVIPTIRPDHLEDEGLDVTQIVTNILAAVGKDDVVVTGEREPEALTAMREWCSSQGVQLIEAKPSKNQIDVPGHHPTNVAVALAVADVLSIDLTPSVAKRALLSASREPDSEIGWVHWFGDQELRFVDIGGANDVESSQEAISRASDFLGDRPTTALIVNKWDRPLRGLAFANALGERQRAHKVIVVGDGWLQSRRALIDAGYKPHDIIHLGFWRTANTRRTLHFLNHLRGDLPEMNLVMFENIHAWPADQLRKAIRRHASPVMHGQPIPKRPAVKKGTTRG